MAVFAVASATADVRGLLWTPLVSTNRKLSELQTPSAPGSYSLATLPDDGSNDWKVTLRLDDEGRHGDGVGGRWRSGEGLRGVVEIAPVVEAPRPITSVIVRAFWQSTTHYIARRVILLPPSTGFLAKLHPSTSNVTAVSEARVEWHRSYFVGGEGQEVWHGGELEAISREVEGDFPLLRQDPLAPPSTLSEPTEAGSGGPWVLPFAFDLPTASRVSASNPLSQAPAARRLLQRFERTPPPSFFHSDSNNFPFPSSVEYVVEALVRLADEPDAVDAPLAISPVVEEEPPSFDAAVRQPHEASFSDYGLLTPSPLLLIQRVVFPFEPSDFHAQDLYSSWRPTITGQWAELMAKHAGITLEEMADDRPITTGLVPSFAKDPRDEALGGAHIGPRLKMQGSLVEHEGGRDKWLSWVKRMEQRSTLGRLSGWIRTEVSCPSPPIIARHAASLPLLFHFSYPTAPDVVATKIKPVSLDKVIITLCRRMLTRGGREERSRFSLSEIRRSEIKLWDESLGMAPTRVSARSGDIEGGRQHLRLVPGEKGHDVRLEFDLQTTDAAYGASKPQIPLRDVPVSFRTPNIEMEYIVSVTVHMVGRSCFFVLRVPLQVVSGDFDDTPAFESREGVPTRPGSPCHTPTAPLASPADAVLPMYSET